MATEVRDYGTLPDHADYFAPTKKLEAAYQNALDQLARSQTELAGLQPIREAAVLEGNAGVYAQTLKRQGDLPSEILMLEIGVAKARVALCEARSDAAERYRKDTGKYGYGIGAEAGFPIGTAAANEALQMYDGARSTVSATSQALANANRTLREVMAQAEGR